jgi:hypothetical protein
VQLGQGQRADEFPSVLRRHDSNLSSRLQVKFAG